MAEEVEMLSRRTQTELLESRIEMDIVPIDFVCESISSKVICAIERAVEVNPYDGDEYVEEYTINLLNDFQMFLQEDGFLLEEGFVEKLKGFGSWLLKILPTLSAIVGPGIIAATAGIGWSILAFLLIVFILGIVDVSSTHGYGQNFEKSQLDAIKDVASVLNTVASAVKNSTEKYKWMYNLTFKNEMKCYQRAGVTSDKFSFRHMLSMKEDSIFRSIITNKTEKKLDIMRNCFLESFLDRISIFFGMYFDCLKKTGDWNEIRRMPDDKYIMMFRMKGGLYPMCDTFRDQAVKAIGTYEKMVEYLFEKTPDKKTQWMLLLNRYILDTRESQDDIKNNFNKKLESGPTFTSEKYRNLGRDTDVQRNPHREYNNNFSRDRHAQRHQITYDGGGS